MTYFMTDELARLCYDSGFEPKLKHGDKIMIVFDSVLIEWDDFEDFYEGDVKE